MFNSKTGANPTISYLCNVKAIQANELIKGGIREIFHYARKINNNFDRDDIHNFRVSVKKLRSFLRLLAAHKPELTLNLSKKFKQLYHIAGLIREAQLEEAWVEQNGYDLPAYKEHLQKTISSQKIEWTRLFSKKLLHKQKLKLTGQCNLEAPQTAVEIFFRKKLSTLNDLITLKKLSAKQLHQARKELKDIIYITDLANKKWPGRKQFLKKLQPDKLKDIAGEIGNYHDKIVQTLHLDTSRHIIHDKSETKIIRKIYRENTLNLMHQKIKLIETLRGLIRSAGIQEYRKL